MGEKILFLLKGGRGSGNREHRGRPGFVGGSLPSRTDPEVRAEKRKLRELYRFTLEHPLAEPQALAVLFGSDKFRVAFEKGPSILDHDGEIVVQGNALKKTGTRSGFGMVKVIWKHGVKSGESQVFKTRLSDILYLPHVLRDITPTEIRVSPQGEPDRWAWVLQRDDGANVVYVVGKLDQRDGTKHVVTIYVRSPNEAIKKALWVSTPGLLPGGGYHSLSLQSQSDGHRASELDPTPFLLSVKSGFMLKASAIPDGARWITVHSHGDGKGTPVLIQETKHGSGVYHVIGGAGGKLNYLKLRGVKSKEHYAQEVREKQSAKREEKKAQVQREKENGTHESQQAARKEVSEKTHAAEREFIRAVGSSLGWKPEEIEPPDVSGLSETAAAAVLRKHHTD